MNVIKFPDDASRRVHSRKPRRPKRAIPEKAVLEANEQLIELGRKFEPLVIAYYAQHRAWSTGKSIDKSMNFHEQLQPLARRIWQLPATSIDGLRVRR